MESTGMQLGFLLLADRAEALNGKIYSMGAGWNQLRFPELPFQWSFSVAVAVDVPWHLTDQVHAMKLHIEGPDGERLGDEFELEFEAGRPPGAVAGQDQRMVLALQTQTTFEVEGPHAVSVSIAGEEVGRSRFSLVRIEQAPDSLA
jgi:hypothetical protein